jgi:hypothetical protein
MLSLTHPDIYNKLQEIESQIEESLKREKQQIYFDFNKQIVEQKKPYLTELLKSIQNDTELEKKYTAHDILTVLESLADQYSVDID